MLFFISSLNVITSSISIAYFLVKIKTFIFYSEKLKVRFFLAPRPPWAATSGATGAGIAANPASYAPKKLIFPDIGQVRRGPGSK